MADLDDLERTKALARRLEGGRYIWGGCSREGSDCSGFMSILLNSLQGRTNVYVRRFSTGNLRDAAATLGLRAGKGGTRDFNLGVIYPWESSSGIGHVAGTLGGLNVESRGGRGVLVGPAARGATAPLFHHHFHLPVSNVREDELPMDQTTFNKLMDGWAATPKGRSALLLAATAKLRQVDVDSDSVWSNTQATQTTLNDVKKLLSQQPPPT